MNESPGFENNYKSCGDDGASMNMQGTDSSYVAAPAKETAKVIEEVEYKNPFKLMAKDQ